MEVERRCWDETNTSLPCGPVDSGAVENASLAQHSRWIELTSNCYKDEVKKHRSEGVRARRLNYEDDGTKRSTSDKCIGD